MLYIIGEMSFGLRKKEVFLCVAAFAPGSQDPFRDMGRRIDVGRWSPLREGVGERERMEVMNGRGGKIFPDGSQQIPLY